MKSYAKSLSGLLFVLSLASAFPAQAGGGGTLYWPSAAVCSGTLQECIDLAVDGDIVEIVTDGPIDESPELNGTSVTLRAGSGYTPVFSSPNYIVAYGGDNDVSISIEGLTLEYGRFICRQTGSGTFTITLKNNTILNSYTKAIEVSSGNTQPPYGPTHFEVIGNHITIDRDPGYDISAISVGGFQDGINFGVINNNQIVQVGGNQLPAIQVANGTPDVEVDIFHNQVSGSNFNSGISVYQYADGSMNARVVNNLVSGQVDVAGAPAAISINVSQGSANVVVNDNTVVDNESGLLVNGRADLGATLSGVAANNIFANNIEEGINIDEDFSSTFVNRRNLVYGNGYNFYVPGAGTVTQDPLFVGANDYRLQSGSPGIDAGANGDVPIDLVVDLNGNPRIDNIVDIGAYENAVIFKDDFEQGNTDAWSVTTNLK